MDSRKKLKVYQMTSNNLPSSLDNFTLHLPETQPCTFQHVDDGNRVCRIVDSLEQTLSNCGKGSTSNIRIELITGHSGIGKSRLASETAKAFQNVSPDKRIAVHLNLANDSIQNTIIKNDFNSPIDALGAIFAIELFEIRNSDLHEYKVNWAMISLLIKRDLPQLEAVVLVMDHFRSSLDTSEKILSACATINSAPSPFYVLPILVGTDPHALDSISTSGMATNVTVLTSLSRDAREAMVESFAKAIDVPSVQLRKAVGQILEDCGGWPSCFFTLWSILVIQSHEDVLHHIRTSGEIDTKDFNAIRSFLVNRLSTEMDPWRFAVLVFQNMVEKPQDDAAAHRARIKCTRIGTQIMERLVSVAMTGNDVPLDQPILRLKEDELEKDDPNLTYRQVKSLVEIQPNVDNSNLGKVIMPKVIVDACKKSLRIE